MGLFNSLFGSKKSAAEQLGNAYLSELQKGAREQPDDPDVQNLLGAEHFKRGQKEEAAAAFRKAVNLAPNDPDHHYNLAKSLADLGKEDEALAEYKRAVSLNPSDSGYHYDLGCFYDDRGQRAQAVEEYRATINCDPDHVSAHWNMAVGCYQAQDWVNAKHHATEAARLGHQRGAEMLQDLASK